jgi:hypothetical protein
MVARGGATVNRARRFSGRPRVMRRPDDRRETTRARRHRSLVGTVSPGERDAAQLLQENLDQEKAMAKRVEALSKELSKQAKSREAEQAKQAELVSR